MNVKDRAQPMRVLMRQLAPFTYPGTTVCVSSSRKLMAVAEAVYVVGPAFEGEDEGESDTDTDSEADKDGGDKSGDDAGSDATSDAGTEVSVDYL